MKKGETGIALGRIETDTPYALLDSWAVGGNIIGFSKWYKAVGATLSPDIVICEQFIGRNIPGADYSPLRIEGACMFIWPDVILQPASGKNTAVPDASLKRLDVYVVGGHHHDIREAVRHAVWYCKKKRHIPTLKAGWPT